jgi:very-short-patch-repair endonuclease
MRPLPEAAQQLAADQSGVITARQLTRQGVTEDAVRARLDSGAWQRIHTGVYATFSGEPGRQALLWAAVLRGGPGAMLSYQTAAEVDGLVRRPVPLIHLTVPSGRRPGHVRGLVIHRSARAQEARHPVLVPPRTRVEETALDLAAAALCFDDALGWVSAACAGRLTTPARIQAAMAQRAKMPYRAGLDAALTDVAAGANTVLEYRYLRDVERPHGLPRARRQVRVRRGGRSEYRDLVYGDYGVVVETDGRMAHLVTAAWRDAHRDNSAAADGFVTLRYSWSDVNGRPCYVARQVAAALAQRGWPGPLRRCGPACMVPAPAPARVLMTRAGHGQAGRAGRA